MASGLFKALALAFFAMAAAVNPPAAQPAKKKPAKEIFGAMTKPVPLAARAIGGYARGCLAGGKMLPVNGPAWQAMRLSRNRNWGHPSLVAYVEKLAADAKAHADWPGLLVGDMAQPAGGPMLTGHASHQIGLDADLWLMPMPDRLLTQKEREDISAVSVLGPDRLSVDPKIWTDAHEKLLKRAVSYPSVARVFVHPAIKKKLCGTDDPDRAWLSKIRPWWGHHYHFHVRLKCPSGSAGCVDQPAAGSDDGCGKELDTWFKRLTAPKPEKPPKPRKPKPPLTLSDLPKECADLAQISLAGAAEPPIPIAPQPPAAPEPRAEAESDAPQAE